MGRSSAPIAGAALFGPMISAFLGRAAGYPTVFAFSAVIMLTVLIVFYISTLDIAWVFYIFISLVIVSGVIRLSFLYLSNKI